MQALKNVANTEGIESSCVQWGIGIVCLYKWVWTVAENVESFHQLWSLGSYYWRHWRGWTVCNKTRIRLDPHKNWITKDCPSFLLANQVLFWFFKNLFYWSIVDLQHWVNFYCKRDSTKYSPVYIIFLNILFHFGLPQDI